MTKLRSLERCSAALLMGCSSGRLRAQQHYEPAGAVLAYLLAGERRHWGAGQSRAAAASKPSNRTACLPHGFTLLHECIAPHHQLFN